MLWEKRSSPSKVKSEWRTGSYSRAFIEAGAIQCGYCSPGLILSAKALLDRTPNPTEDEIRRGFEFSVMPLHWICAWSERGFKWLQPSGVAKHRFHFNPCTFDCRQHR
jgi:hypothetical protein